MNVKEKNFTGIGNMMLYNYLHHNHNYCVDYTDELACIVTPLKLIVSKQKLGRLHCDVASIIALNSDHTYLCTIFKHMSIGSLYWQICIYSRFSI